MIATISEDGDGFENALRYDNKKDSEEIMINNLSDFKVHRVREFRAVAEGRCISHPVFKDSLSLSQGERGTAEQWVGD